MADNKITALYCRLSKEDERTNEGKFENENESESIQNQKKILQKYADDKGFTNTRFFVDDGYSGTNFQRPHFSKMMELVNSGQVGAIIVKDHSRLGRDYIEIGKLMQTFILNEIRYIAVSDGIDTSKGLDDLLPFRDVFNEWYARDISKKIRAVKKAQAQRGERVNGQVLYGYLIDPDDKNHLIPDPETADNVKQIFAMFVQGKRMCEIKKWLQDNKVFTPGELRYRRTGQTWQRPREDNLCGWRDNTVYHLLAQHEYMGHTVTAKSSRVSYKHTKVKKNPDPLMFKNTHEALIDEATFEMAQKRIATRNRPTKMEEIDLFSGLLRCADCDGKMYLMRGTKMPEHKFAYTCSNYRNSSRNNVACTSHYLRRDILKELVLADLQRVLGYVKENEENFIRKATEYGDKETEKAMTQKRKALNKAQKRMGELNTLFCKLYEDNALGKITDQQFAFLTSNYDTEKIELAENVTVLENEINTEINRKSDAKRFVQIVNQYTDIQELDYEIVHAFIDRILVHALDKETNTRKIEIIYNFVGKVDSDDEPTENISYYRQMGVDVKSIAV